MVTLGIDIGSTTSKCALLKDGAEIIATSLYSGGIGTDSPGKALAEVFSSSGYTINEVACSTVTGYGRGSFKGADYQVSELSCHALGGAPHFSKAANAYRCRRAGRQGYFAFGERKND